MKAQINLYEIALNLHYMKHVFEQLSSKKKESMKCDILPLEHRRQKMLKKKMDLSREVVPKTFFYNKDRQELITQATLYPHNL